MKFTRIRLQDFKCYADADLRLDEGVTVVHGLNGSGKSTLLESCFFALYGTKALDRTLDDVVSIGADDTTVELWFTHAGGDYHVERRVRMSEERAQTAKAVLETPEGAYEGARDVRRKVTDLLRMDHEAFVNCAYVRQGEVNKLINASPGDRQDMIDDLLQLGKLEEYRERASDARVGVGRVRDDKQGALSQLDEQIEEKEAKDLHDRLADLRTEVSEVAEEIERIEAQRERAVTTRQDAESVLEEYEEKREELREVEADVEDLREAIEETETEREELREAIAHDRERLEECRTDLVEAVAETDLDASDADDVTEAAVDERLGELDERDDDLQEEIKEASVGASEHASAAESLEEQADDLAERAEEKRSEAADLAEQIESTREAIADRRERLSAIDEEIEDLESTFDDAPVAPDEVEGHRDEVANDLEGVRERVTELETTIENEREALAEAERLREAGKCPECGQDVGGSPHVESIEADRERVADLESELEDARERRDELRTDLEAAEDLVESAAERDRLTDKRETLGELIDDKAAGLEDDEETVERLREGADEFEATATEKRAEAETEREAADEKRSEVAEFNRERQAIDEQVERLTEVADLLDEAAELSDEIERRRERRSEKEEVLEERRERLADKRERADELAEAVDEDAIAEARSERERAADYVEKADDRLEELRERQSKLQESAGAVENEIEELAELRDRREDLEAILDRLEDLYEESTDLQELYADLRAELRQRNVETLERMVNETFELVYGNDSYSRIDLDGEYRLTVYQKDGEPLDPEQLSGGERALFNLSLRCAIYRLLAEGIEGAAPTPPLILDEPTVFLDSGHVTRLLDLIEYMRDDVGVEQIVVVSHDDELVGAADALVRVEKDATTNRSSVERVTGELAGIRAPESSADD